jgi:hypothetical protein
MKGRRALGAAGTPVPVVDDFDEEVKRLEGIISYPRQPGTCEGEPSHGNDPDTCAQALVELLRLHAMSGRPAPTWILWKLLDAFDAFREGRADSVNHALGMQKWDQAKRNKIVDKTTGLSLAARIVIAVDGRGECDPVDEFLFERVAKAMTMCGFKMSGSKAKAIYYDSRGDPPVLAEIAAFRKRYRLTD